METARTPDNGAMRLRTPTAAVGPAASGVSFRVVVRHSWKEFVVFIEEGAAEQAAPCDTEAVSTLTAHAAT